MPSHADHATPMQDQAEPMPVPTQDGVPSGLIDIAEAAAQANRSVDHIRRLIRDGRLTKTKKVHTPCIRRHPGSSAFPQAMICREIGLLPSTAVMGILWRVWAQACTGMSIGAEGGEIFNPLKAPHAPYSHWRGAICSLRGHRRLPNAQSMCPGKAYAGAYA